ncbi:N-6 DNA methylase [Sphingosinicella terrae]|uniref:N-6 DNA methylase n=1 Tax=Sphingosinicella terrae TaxID=2172047 RepID=UPI002547290C|nr:N-6 DNA methylase [Sphingosinicella terrae]
MLDTDAPELLPYATLVNAWRAGSDTLGVAGAVYEWQEAPLIFLVDGAQLADETHLRRLRRLLAMRGDVPYLGVLSPGRLDVFAVALDSKRLRQVQVKVVDEQVAQQDVLSLLANARPKAARNSRSWISDVVLRLLTRAIDQLTPLEGVDDEDAISLVGRALFTRFLADRGLLPAGLDDVRLAGGMFDDAVRAAETCAWLDATFNGDLLPLPEGIFERLSTEAYKVLGDIMRRAPGGQLVLGWEEKWDHLDFAHIPVGVLSQAYELYLRSHAPAKQRREGGYYTPRPIADLLVRASFRALDREGASAHARVLDPAAGAGVFLLTAFRELVAARWRADGVRPNTKVLRDILYRQITGFDINEAALRFAALGLYLMSIELDPEPQPIDKLGFDNLRGAVLHRFAANDEIPGGQLGSLGPQVGQEHVGKYDIVVGNPPWASGTKLPDWSLICAQVARIASDRLGAPLAPPLPNEVLDLPFVWRAMEWAKPGGQIAFALHARLLFQQGDGMADARRALFRALDITSVINGVELRQTKVWPEILAPFCLLIAANRTPGPGAGFRLISPRLESCLNAAGAMRIDAHSAEIIPTEQLGRTPELLKILFRGTKADLGLVERIRSKGFPTLESFWCEAIGRSSRGYLAGAGNGYQTLKASSRFRKRGDGMPGVPAEYLHGLPVITPESLDDLLIDTNALEPFGHERIHDPRDPGLFVGPIAIVHQSPPARLGRMRVGVADQAAAYNESFYGYSPSAFEDAHLLVRYLALVLGSKFALWLALITSGKFGFERDVVEKAALNRMPLPDFRMLSSEQRQGIDRLFDEVRRDSAAWEHVDRWVSELYGLGTADIQTITDTLRYNLPFADTKAAAQAAPKDLKHFCTVLERELAPWAERFGASLHAVPFADRASSPWRGVKLQRVGSRTRTDIPQDWEGLLRVADAGAASEMIVRGGSGAMFIARLAQQRYWTETQARLLAQRIVWTHLDFLSGSAAA